MHEWGQGNECGCNELWLLEQALSDEIPFVRNQPIMKEQAAAIVRHVASVLRKYLTLVDVDYIPLTDTPTSAQLGMMSGQQ